MSSDLQWLLIRKYNSFMVKKVPEGPVFSREAGNLPNLHSYKYSGLANSKTVAVADTGSNVQITYTKKSASPHAVNSAKATYSIRSRSGPRRSLGVAAKLTKRGYRADLRPVLLARVSALSASKKEPKSRPAKKPRGKKAKAATA
ncbi:ribosomal protein L28e [Neolentinus lepideus HHB14362 ss-1]|uniref:Ribosomal protein L28e n=1 Tax=Neolentinus lepideus HHB14362 ss-1 TaxID=1314782 RepID=A0A165U4F2_9AGAM|nr:ribosomal protein L28e [Neolentinus lepideus HHB14362 ss-1]